MNCFRGKSSGACGKGCGSLTINGAVLPGPPPSSSVARRAPVPPCAFRGTPPRWSIPGWKGCIPAGKGPGMPAALFPPALGWPPLRGGHGAADVPLRDAALRESLFKLCRANSGVPAVGLVKTAFRSGNDRGVQDGREAAGGTVLPECMFVVWCLHG